MAWALIVTTILAIVFFLLINKTISWDFYVKSNAAWWNFRWAYTDQVPPLPIWPYPALLAVFMTPSRVVQFIVTGHERLVVRLVGHRVPQLHARHLCRRLRPSAAGEADADPRTRTPIYALALMVLPSLVISALFAWNIFSFQSLTLCSTLVTPSPTWGQPSRHPAAPYQAGTLQGLADRQVPNRRHPADHHRRGHLRRFRFSCSTSGSLTPKRSTASG
jgi:hypothetical protein